MEALATCSISAAPKALADHLAAVKPAVGTRSAISALGGVRIYVDSNPPRSHAYLEATDMEVAVRRELATGGIPDLHSVTIGGRMDVIVSHADLSKAVKLFAKREVVSIVDADADNVAVTDGARTVKLRKLSSDNWPKFAGDAEGAEPLFFASSGAALSPVLLRATAFTSKDETRPILTGVAFIYAEDHPHVRGMRVWATDSYRLADLSLPAGALRAKPDGEPAIVNVVGRGVAMAAKAMRKAREVTVSTVNDHAIIGWHGETWTVRLIGGQYPNFRQLVPDSAEVIVKLPTADLLGACEVANTFARKNAPMRLSVNGEVKVTGSTPDVCEFEELLPNASYSTPNGYDLGTEAMEVGLNAEFVRDIAKAHVGETAEVRLISPLRPVLFVEGDDLYLQMPIRLNI